MANYTTTESKQLWEQTTSGQVLFLDAIAPQDETDESAEYRYVSQGFDMGSELDLVSNGWVKIEHSEYVGMPFAALKERLAKERENMTPEQQQRFNECQALSARFPIRERASKTKTRNI